MRSAWLAVIMLGTLAYGQGFEPLERPGEADMDVRLPERQEDRAGFVMRAPGFEQLAQADALAAELPGLVLRWDGMSGAPKWLAAPAGHALSQPASGDPAEIARAFLRSRAALFGLRPGEEEQLHVSSVIGAPDGGRYVHLMQTISGIEVYGGRINVNLNPDGSVRSVGARFFGGASSPTPPTIDAAEALRLAARDVYPYLAVPTVVASTEDQDERVTVFEQAGFARSPRTRLMLFPMADEMRLAWEVRVAEPGRMTDYRILVDAQDARLLLRWNATAYAEARYLDANGAEPETEEVAPAQHRLGTIPALTPESPLGWINGSGTDLTGNNATSHLRYASEAGLSEPSAIYDYPFNTLEAALVNAWWWVNDAHDRFYAHGFDEEAGNYQADNGSSPGLGGDAMQVVAWSAGGRSWANYTFSVDGEISSLNFRWSRCRFCSDHDGYPENGGERNMAFMRDIVYHEYTHGVSTRMVGGPADDTCLLGIQSAALGEGWSNIFADSFNDNPTHAAYFTESNGCINDARHGLTYDDLCGVAAVGCEVHADGMIWEGALWDLRESMRAFDPAGGIADFEWLVVQALAATPCNPTMLDARDGLFDADNTLFSGVHHEAIWNIFAARGMGKNASSTGEGDTAPVTDTTVPGPQRCSAPDAPTDLVAAVDGSNAILLTYDASGAAAVEIWREDLDIPFDRPARIASSNSLTSYRDETVQGGRAYRYHLVALGDGGAPCRSDPSLTVDATATGTCEAYPIFDPGLSVDDGDAECVLTLNWNPASPGCPGAPVPIVYNVYRAPTPGFDAADRLLIGRTTGTSLQDVPPDTDEDDFNQQTGRTAYYLVLAQHGTLGDPPDHRDRGSAQLLRWAPGLPILGREVAYSWSFDSGPDSWTVDNSDDPDGGWVLVDPSPSHYGESLLAPDEPAGGTGTSWVTGDAGGPASPAANDCDGLNWLISPTWDATDGSTILSFDYWAHEVGSFIEGIEVWIDNGSELRGIAPVALMTVPSFETAGQRGWQRAELDLAAHVAPTSTMTVKFRSYCTFYLTEFGIDNVSIDRATACARSGLLIDGVSVDDAQAGWGNGNGVLEPGETARLDVTLRNEGSTTAFSSVGTLVGCPPGTLVHEQTAAFPDIPAAGTGTSLGDGFTVTAPADAGCESTLALEFEFIDAAGATTRATWDPEFGHSLTEVVFADSFETDKGWTVMAGVVGRGRWQRGDPVGTVDGGNPANPEDDSPNDAGSQCWITENGPIGGAADANDVDNYLGVYPILASPSVDLSGYKRARFSFDLWHYDDTSATVSQDYAFYQTYFDESYAKKWFHYPVTGGWETVDRELTSHVPMTPGLQLVFASYDRNPESIVEMGVDNVLVEADRQVCDPLGVVNPPNGVGDTVLLTKSDGEADIAWQASVVDATHDGAAYYEVWVSSMPTGGFAAADTAAATSSTRALDPSDEYYLVSAMNAAGTSGDEPTP